MQSGQITVYDSVVALHTGQLSDAKIEAVAWQRIGEHDIAAVMLNDLVVVASAEPKLRTPNSTIDEPQFEFR